MTYYERFLRSPAALVLMALWFVGVALLTVCILALYPCPTLLIRILA